MVLERDLEASIQMRLYKMTKGQFGLLFLAFLVVISCGIFVGVMGPSVVVQKLQLASTMDNKPSDFRVGPFTLVSPPLSVFQRDLWLVARILRAPLLHDAGLTLKLDTTVQILVPTVLPSEEPTKNDTQRFIQLGNVYHQTLTLSCMKTVCEELLLAHMAPVDFTLYKFILNFRGLITSQTNSHTASVEDNPLLDIEDITFSFQYYNTYFTYLEITSRFVCFLIAGVVMVLFMYSLRLFPFRDWTIEQRWCALLLPLLLLYNNPFHPLLFLSNSVVPRLLDTVFQATFLCAVLLFWLCVYHGIRVTSRSFWIFYFPKCFVVGCIWLSLVILQNWKTYMESTYPLFDALHHTHLVLFFVILFLTTGVIYVIFLLILLMRDCAELHRQPYFVLRLKFLTCISVLVVTSSLITMVLRFGSGFIFGSHKFTQVASILGKHGNTKLSNIEHISAPGVRSAAEFSVLHAIINTQIVAMAIVYSPSRNALVEANFKDNPSVSMLNDNEEDVLFESDGDETQMTTFQRH